MTDGAAQTGTQAEGEVSRLVAVAREQGRADAYVGKRRWTRYAIGMRLEVTADPDKPGNTWVVRTHNISGGGLGFWSSQEVEKGVVIFLREWSEGPGARWVAGRVTYCTLGIGGYLVGVAFDAASQPDAILDHNDLIAPASPPVASSNGKGVPSGRSLSTQCAMRSALAGAAAAAIGSQLAHASGLNGVNRPVLALISALTTGGLLGWLMLRREGRFLIVLQEAIRQLAAGTPSSIRLPPGSSRELSILRQAVLDLGSKWRRHDDAERIQRQRLEELTRIKSNILSIVSHDLRTPLTSILLYTRMLTEELDTMPKEDQRGFLGIISDECTRLSRLLDDLLEVQRLESGRVEWHMKRQDLSQTIRSSARVFEAMARNNSIEFTVNCPDRLPFLEFDADKMAQVLSNLLSNAMKYTPAGGKVDLFAEVRTDHVLICVSDNGPGIPRDKWDQIFDRFSQLSRTDTREIAGVGLGLYIVREIVQRHGGRVWVDSELGCGSDFFVSLPVESDRTQSEGGPKENLPPGRVVFCDADPELAAVVAQTLRQEGFEVQVVHSARRLLERLMQGEVDVVVTDVLLPDMTTADLLSSIEELQGRSFQLILHSYEGPDLPMGRVSTAIPLRRPAFKEELIRTVRLALQKKRSPAGLTILLVSGDDSNLDPLGQALSRQGHTCLTAMGVGAAAEQVDRFSVDLVLVNNHALALGWENLRLLKLRGGDGPRVIVLCGEVHNTEKHLAEAHNTAVIAYAADSAEATASAVMTRVAAPVPEPHA